MNDSEKKIKKNDFKLRHTILVIFLANRVIMVNIISPSLFFEIYEANLCWER